MMPEWCINAKYNSTAKFCSFLNAIIFCILDEMNILRTDRWFPFYSTICLVLKQNFQTHPTGYTNICEVICALQWKRSIFRSIWGRFLLLSPRKAEVFFGLCACSAALDMRFMRVYYKGDKSIRTPTSHTLSYLHSLLVWVKIKPLMVNATGSAWY